MLLCGICHRFLFLTAKYIGFHSPPTIAAIGSSLSCVLLWDHPAGLLLLLLLTGTLSGSHSLHGSQTEERPNQTNQKKINPKPNHTAQLLNPRSLLRIPFILPTVGLMARQNLALLVLKSSWEPLSPFLIPFQHLLSTLQTGQPLPCLRAFVQAIPTDPGLCPVITLFIYLNGLLCLILSPTQNEL